ncbi:hypothetical protein Tsubulata_006651, partial [Turnera subulata]
MITRMLLNTIIFNKTSLACLIALLLGIKAITIYGRTKLDLSEAFDRAKVIVGRAQTVSQTAGVEDKPFTSQFNDKLLGGLLPSGFNEESCLSRYQSSFYRKHPSQKPSPYLLSKLRQYELLHRRCGPHTKSYSRTLQQLHAGDQRFNATDCKYVVWVDYSGLGNKILTMAASFLYALLTNRVLLIEQPDDMANLFCEPFPNTSWLLPTDFPIDFNSLSQEDAHCYGKVLKDKIINGSPDKLPSFLYLHLPHDYNDYDKLFFCDEHQTPLKQVPWLILVSNNYFVPALFQMPSFEQELDRMFPNKETVFHHLGRYLFHPSNHVWGLIIRYYQAYLARADEIVGIQIRVFDSSDGLLQHVMDQILACTQRENLLPQLLDTQTPVAYHSGSRTSKAILVTSLYTWYYEHLKDMYWLKPTSTGEVIGIHQPSQEGSQQFGNNMHNVKAWAEMNLLSFSNVLVTSGWSTFGYVAQGLGGLKPWILFKPQNQTTPEPPCQRVMSTEPCFHSPPEIQCKGKINEDKGSVLNVRHCEDELLCTYFVSFACQFSDDKLLGGLLASGIDEESCLSRHQSSLYRKTSPHKPSAYLLSKLRKYEDLHKRCGPYTESYNRTMQLLDTNSTKNSTADCNYIVWIPSNGLGNRILSMASSFLYALLTNRVLLVHFGGDMDDLFCEPFPNTSWLLPKEFRHPGNKYLHSYGSLLKNNNNNTSNLLPPSFLYLCTAFDCHEYDKLFLQDEYQAFLEKVPWLLLRSEQYFAPYLFLMQSFKQEITKMFPDKEATFHHLGRYLFHPSNQAWGLITRFYETYLAKADERVGLQVRVFDTKASPSEKVRDQILACLTWEKLLPQLDPQNQRLVASPSKNRTSKAVLVTSLYPVYYEYLKNMYWLKPSVNGEIVGIYQPSHEEFQHSDDNMHNVKALAEIYLLSLSDTLVTSSWSTFGYVAHGLAGLRPWILFMPDQQWIPDPPCKRAMSMEPCFHFPPNYDIQARKILDTGPLDPQIRHCEDVDHGELLYLLSYFGFDEESCLSRYQSVLYRKNSPHKPSAYLVSKLRKYEELHKRCGPYTESYNRTLQKLDTNTTGNSTTDCNYVVWLPSNGLGNRIISTAATFLYALLTNRILLVRYGTDMDDLFCEPFPNTSWLLPKEFPLWNQFDNDGHRSLHSYGSLLKNNNRSTSNVPSPSFLYLCTAFDYEEYDKLFYQGEYQPFLEKVPWLFLRSDQYFVPYLFLMQSFKQEITNLFPDKYTIFHHLGRYLFHPSNQAWGLITRFYETYLARADKRMGLQVRVFDPKASPSEKVTDSILACIKQEKLLPELENQRLLAASPSKNQTSKAVLVTSLYSVYYEYLKNMYWLKPSVGGENVGIYQPSHEEFQHFGDNMHNVKALAEIYLLSLSDMLVTSSWSTFGYVAHGLAGLRPWLLFMPYRQWTPNPPCKRAMSMEPCFHFPPNFDRKAHKIHDTGAHDPHIRQCEDVDHG